MSAYIPNEKFTTARALVVDDAEENRFLLSRLLIKMNYEVIEAENGQEAINLYQENKPDIIFMDVMMPVMDGYQATRKIKELSGDDFVPVIFITALDKAEDIETCIEVGGDDFLAKPFNLTVLKSKILALERIRGVYRRVYELNQTLDKNKQIPENLLQQAIFAKNSQISTINSSFEATGQTNNDIFLLKHTPANGLNLLLGSFNTQSPISALGTLPCSEVFRSMTDKGFCPKDIVNGINSKLTSMLPSGVYLNAIFINFNLQLNQLNICNLNMPDVFVVSDKDKIITKKISANNGQLGFDTKFDSQPLFESIEISKDNRIILAGNGLHKIQNNANELFSGEHLEQSIKHSIQSNNIIEGLKNHVGKYIGNNKIKHTLSIIEIPCNFTLLSSESNLLTDVIRQKKDAKPVINKNNSVDFEIKINGKNLRHVDPVPILINFLQEIAPLDKQRESLFTIFTEIYVNALDHGILKLESSTKNTSDGFYSYYKKRKEMLESLSSGFIQIKISLETDDRQNRLSIFIKDSGSGFDYNNLENDNPQTSQLLSGRGITLIRALCDKFEYAHPGNQSTAIYVWSNE